MYNIIQSKYRYVFLICILCILVGLFMRSTKIIEGKSSMKKKKPKKKPKKKKGKKKSERTKEEIRNTNTIKTEVNKQVPPLVASMVQAPITNINNTQATAKNLLDTLQEKQTNVTNSVNNLNRDIKDTSQEYSDKLSKAHDEKLSILSQQYQSYNTGLLTQTTEATESIKKTKSEISNVLEQANQALDASRQLAEDSKQSAAEAKNHANNIFKALSANIIHNNNNTFKKEPFEPMDGSGYTAKNSYTSCINGATKDMNLFDLEKELIQTINEFNTTYYSFARCSSSGTGNCNERDIITKSDAVNCAATNLTEAYTKKVNIYTSDASFNINRQELMNKAKSVDEFRRSLDSKMDAIIKSKNPPNELTQQYDSTVYTGILWSVLATSVLFYIFTEM